MLVLCPEPRTLKQSLPSPSVLALALCLALSTAAALPLTLTQVMPAFELFAQVQLSHIISSASLSCLCS